MVQQALDMEDPVQKRATRKLLFAGILCIVFAVVSAAIAVAVVLQQSEKRRIPHDGENEKLPSSYSNQFLLSSSSLDSMSISKGIEPFSTSISSEVNIVFTKDLTNYFPERTQSDLSTKVFNTVSSQYGIFLSSPFIETETVFTSSLSRHSILSGHMNKKTSYRSHFDVNIQSTPISFHSFSFSTSDNGHDKTLKISNAFSDPDPQLSLMMTTSSSFHILTSPHNASLTLNPISESDNAESMFYSVSPVAISTSYSFDSNFASLNSLSHTRMDTNHSTEQNSSQAILEIETTQLTSLMLTNAVSMTGLETSFLPSATRLFSSKLHNHHSSTQYLDVFFTTMAFTSLLSQDLEPSQTTYTMNTVGNTKPSTERSMLPISVVSTNMTSFMVSSSATFSSTIYPDCGINEFRCTSGQCVSQSNRCDGVIHCEDLSDEVNCSNCQGFECDSGLCLWSWSVRCNKRVECMDLSDEIGCDFGTSYRRCENGIMIPSHKWCDNVDDCFDNSDEKNCSCSFREVSCTDGRCIREEWICDGHVDCINGTGSDESQCGMCDTNEFKCSDYACINSTKVCDGIQHCQGFNDENRCYTIEEDLPLTVYYKGDNYTMCSTYWNSSISDYICQSLGFKNSTKTQFLSENTDTRHMKLELDQQVTDNRYLLQTVSIRYSCTSNLTVSISCMQRDCGEQSPNLMVPFVSGGDLAVAGQWPWVVSLSYLGRPLCSGTLISEEWVVTAGHCVARPGSHNYTSNPEYIEVQLGTTKGTRGQEKNIHTDRIIHHPQLQVTGIGPIYHDIALVHLSNPVTFTDHVSPVCLPNTDLWDLNHCYIAGWGYVGPSQDVTVEDLRSAKLHVLSDDECEQNTVHMEERVNTNITLCALYKLGVISGCQGDSGSPLMCRDTATGKWSLAGVMSSGAQTCGQFSNTANRFTKVSAMMKWIQDIVNLN